MSEQWANLSDSFEVTSYCGECGSGLISETSWHHHDCSLRPRNQILRQIEIAEHNVNALRIRTKRLKVEVERWNGKYLMVKQENNALRKKFGR